MLNFGLSGSLLIILLLLYRYHLINRQFKTKLEEQRQLVVKLRKESDLMKKTIDQAPIGFGAIIDRRITRVNQRICDIMGYSREELIGSDTRMFYHSDDDYKKYGQLIFQQLKESGHSTIEIEMVNKSGRPVNILTSTTLIAPGDPRSSRTITLTNLTDIKNTKAKLSLSEDKFQLIMDAMNDPAYIGSKENHQISYMNRAMSNRIGYDAVGELCYKALHGLDKPCKWCPITLKEATQNNSVAEEIISPLDNRSYLTTHSNLRGQDNKNYILTIFKDTTDFNAIEKQLFQSQKMEAIGKLAGGVAHDFNNILTVIRGHSQLGMMDIDSKNPLWNDFNEIEKAASRAARLTRQLLAFSRRQIIKPEIIIIDQFLNDFGKMLKRLIGEDITLTFKLDKNISPIKADVSQLEQVIINLLVNSSDAIKENQAVNPEISISTTEEFVDNTLSKSGNKIAPGNYILIAVTDNGCGMIKEVTEHVFEPFYTTKEIGKGTGLGLSTVYGIVKQNQGEIEIESRIGAGTTFKVYWPCDKTLARKEENNDNLNVMLKGDEVILLAEDEENTRKLAHRLLQKAGYTVIVAKNGVDALALAQSCTDNIDLLFTDIIMPKMGGVELSENFATLYPKAKILFTTGYLGDRIDQGDVNFKRHPTINKPYNVGELLNEIRTIMDDKKREQNPDFNRRKSDSQPQ